MQVDFYRLGATPLPRVLMRIAGRVLASGGRLLVVAGDGAAALDEALWEGQDSFLPHGVARDEDSGADQPVLIAGDCATAANGARNVALTDGVWRDAALGYDRAFHFFDADSIDAARTAWRGLAGRENVTRNFWEQRESGWEKIA